jgi:hypothetical protein
MSFIEREKTHSVACCEQYKDLSAMHRSRGDCLRDDTTIAGGVFDRQGELAACHSDFARCELADIDNGILSAWQARSLLQVEHRG